MEIERKRRSFSGGPILTTETPRAIAARVVCLLFFGIMGASFTLIGPWVQDGASDQFDAFLTLGGMQLLLIGTALFASQFPGRGRWELEEEDITFQPCHGPRRTLTWSTVERVLWRQDSVDLRGHGVRIQIPWGMFPEYQRGPARAFSEAKLSATFDLKDVYIPASSMSKAKMIAISVGTFIPWAGLMWFGVSILPVNSWRWVGPALAGITLLYFGGLSAYGFILVWADLDPVRRIHPEWPWRLPRKNSLELAGHKTDDKAWLDEP